MKNEKNVKDVGQLLKAQLITTLLFSIISWLAWDNRGAISALLGGIVAWLPSALFAKKLFQYQGAQQAPAIVKSFYIAEMLKIAFASILFAVVFIGYKVLPQAFFLTYIIVVMNFWFAPLLVK